MIQIIVHMDGSEPVKIDVEEMPDPNAYAILGKNPRDRGDREVTWIDDGVTTIMLPWWRINYIQILPSDDEAPDFPMPFRMD